MGAHRGKQPPRRKRLESSRLVDLATPAPPVLEVLFACRSLALSTTIALCTLVLARHCRVLPLAETRKPRPRIGTLPAARRRATRKQHSSSRLLWVATALRRLFFRA
jgi:hypothetical protein